MKSIFLIGIGGIGMSALARFYKSQGLAVSGSDSAKSQITTGLEKDAIKVKIGHKRANIGPDVGLVIYNRAIPADNPELVESRRRGIRVLPYAEALGELTEQYNTIAITGSHGKSTTTALAGLALIKGGLDPIVMVGTNLKEFNGKNFRASKLLAPSSYLVLEADDFGAAFLAYSPCVSIITNIDKEHMDFYKNFSNVKDAFLKFIATTQEGGALILNRDDKVLWSLHKRIAAIAQKERLKTIWYSTKNPTSKKLQAALKIPGEHNLSNAMAVYELGKLLKLSEKNTIVALGSYHGSWRRMEYKGKMVNGKWKMDVYDDYAHHPTEIKATLKAFKGKYPRSPIICVFQPHQTQRLKLLFKDFVSSFADADILVMIPSYRVAGRDSSADWQTYNSQTLAAAISKKYPRKKIYYLDQPKHIKKMLIDLFKLQVPSSYLLSPLVIMMGAGDIVNYTHYLTK